VVADRGAFFKWPKYLYGEALPLVADIEEENGQVGAVFTCQILIRLVLANTYMSFE